MDIAELGYKVDSSGLEAGTKALDENTAAAGRTEAAADRLGKGYQAVIRTLQQTSTALGDRLVGSMDKMIGTSGAVLAELQLVNKSMADWMAMVSQTQAALTNLEARENSVTAATNAAAAANKQAADAAQAAAIAATKEAQAIADQDARLRAVAAAGIAYAESMSTANLSDRALAEAALLASGGLDLQAKSTANAATEQERMAARARALEEAEARLANQAKAAAAAVEAEAIDLKKLTGDIDPVVAKLNRLADAEGRLEKAANLGLVKPAQFQQLQGQIDATREKILNAGKDTDQFNGALGRLNIQSAETQRNLSQMVTYAVTGNLQMAGNQVMQLGNQAGIAGALFSGTGLAVGGFTAVVLAGILAWKQGTDQLFEFQKGLILAGKNADVSASQFGDMVSQLDHISGVSAGNAVSALNAVGASGKLAGQDFMGLAESAARMEAATGQSVSKTVAAFESIADSPVDALLKLNESEGFLDRSQAARIVTLQQEGHEQTAVSEALALYAQHLDEVAEKANEKMPAITKWWHGVTNEITGAWQEAKTYGAMIDEIVAKHATLKKAQDASSISNTAGSIFGLGGLIPQGRLSTLGTILNAAGKQYLGGLGGQSDLPKPIYDPGEDKRKDVSDYTKALQENKVAEDAASQALNARLAGLDRVSAKQAAYNKIVELYNKLPDNDPRHFDGSMDKLVAQSNTQIDKQWNQKEGLNKKNTDDNSAQSFVESIQRQITANQELAATGTKVSASDKMVIQAKQLLADKTNTMTAATRKLLQALIPTLETTDAQAQAEVQKQRGLQATAALTERLAQLENQRQQQSDIDLMGLSHGSDQTSQLQRQLDIQREYLQEKEKLDKAQRDKNTALSDEDYKNQQKQLEDSLNRSLDIERSYQQQRLSLQSDWSAGAKVAWENFSTDAINYNQQAQTAVSGFLTSTTDSVASQIDALVKGNESIGDAVVGVAKSMANSVISALEQMAAQWLVYEAVQLLVGKTGAATAATTLVGNALATQAQAALAAYASTAAIPIVGPELAPAAATAALAATAPFVALVSTGALSGMAHDGINSVPADGTWLLQKGERVMTAQTSAALDKTLESVRNGQGGGGNTYSPQIYITGDPDAKTLAALNSMLDAHGRKFSQQTYDRVSGDLATGRGKVSKGLIGGNNVSRRLK